MDVRAFIFLASIFICTVFSCGSDDEVTPLVQEIEITSFKVTQLSSQSQDGQNWDDDGTAPDLYVVMVIGNGGVRQSRTDTLYNFEVGQEFRLLEPIRLVRGNDNVVTLKVLDYDNDLSIPADFREDDELSEFINFFWTSRDNFIDQDVRELSNDQVTLAVSRRIIN